MWNRFKTLDPWLYLLPVFLSFCGIAGIYSITYTSTDNTGGIDNLVIRQAVYVLVGVVALLVFTFIDYRSLKGWSFVFYILSLLLIIILALLPESSPLAVRQLGAKRWLDLKVLQFQPSETVKLSVIVALSSLFSQVHGTLRWRRFILALLALVIPVVIIMKQPDLGTAIIIVLSATLIIFSAGLEKKQWLVILTISVLLITTLTLSYWHIKPFDCLLHDYQRQRINTFFNPDLNPQKEGYNIIQSVIAVGSGGIFGKGLGYGSQSQLYFLPFAHSDFIFASLAESWGFIGALSIILIYAILLSRIINAINIAKDRFGLLLAVGIFGMFLAEVMINIGMNIKLLPVTGIPLPFLSYGGTSLISSFASLGMIQSIVMRYKKINF